MNLILHYLGFAFVLFDNPEGVTRATQDQYHRINGKTVRYFMLKTGCSDSKLLTAFIYSSLNDTYASLKICVCS